MRATAAALAAVATRGSDNALRQLFDVGAAAREPVRSPVALAVARVAIRNTPLVLAALARDPDRDALVGLLADGFDMLEEDFEEERFFVTVRQAYWRAEEGSIDREVGEMLVNRLDF
jgi:hypothetical protein